MGRSDCARHVPSLTPSRRARLDRGDGRRSVSESSREAWDKLASRSRFCGPVHPVVEFPGEVFEPVRGGELSGIAVGARETWGS